MAVCLALGVSRSNVLSKKSCSSEWVDLRMSPPKAYNAELKNAIAFVAKNRATYGYRMVWARLKIDVHQINHKRVYRVMCDEGLLVQTGSETSGHEETRVHSGS